MLAVGGKQIGRKQHGKNSEDSGISIQGELLTGSFQLLASSL
jgi:hypothetical protein